MLSLLLPLAAVIVIYVVRMIELRTRRELIQGPILERLSFRLFWFVGTGITIAAIAEYFVRENEFHWPWFVSGCALGFASFALRRRAIAALGRFWSLHVEIRETHQLVKSGPFRWLRHPTYFSMLLELLAVAVVLEAIYTICLIPVLYFPALAYRLHLEEPALIEKFGDAYREYMRTTPAFLPYKWPTQR